MTVVDTSAWIEWLTDSPLATKLAPAFPTPLDWIVPTIVQLELAKWITRELGEDRADEVIAFASTCTVVPLTTDIALAAAEATKTHKLATADAIIYATAQQNDAQLLTCDHHFEGLPGVTFIPKT